MKTYQDQWIKGKLVAKGTVECASRYEIIKSFCTKRFSGRFTVCDIGANMCYFGIRLCEDFPDCTVTAFEPDRFKVRAKHVLKNDLKRLTLFSYRLDIMDLNNMSSYMHFDLILALNVLHHVGDEFNAWMVALRKLGSHVIAEFALSDSRSRRQAIDYGVPSNAKVLGYAESHIKREIKRPIVLI